MIWQLRIEDYERSTEMKLTTYQDKPRLCCTAEILLKAPHSFPHRVTGEDWYNCAGAVGFLHRKSWCSNSNFPSCYNFR